MSTQKSMPPKKPKAGKRTRDSPPPSSSSSSSRSSSSSSVSSISNESGEEALQQAVVEKLRNKKKAAEKGHSALSTTAIAPSQAKMVDYNDLTHPLVCGGVQWNVKLHALSHKYSRILEAKHFISGQTDSVAVVLKSDASDAKQQRCTPEGLKSLLDAAEPSLFGHGSDNVYDESVRKGKEVKADRLDIKFVVRDYIHGDKFIDIRETSVPRFIARWLRVPFDCVRLGCSKLALYEVGGHFSTHRDTNRGPEHVATLLVSVPSEYEGGEFVLTLPTGEEKVWAPAGKPEFFAFHADLEHVVKPVTKGLRASLQYDVYVKASGKNDLDEYSPHDLFEGTTDPKSVRHTNAALKSVKSLKHIDDAVDAFVAALSEHVTGKKAIALPLVHLYTKTSIRPRYLKSIDRVLFDRVLKAGYTVALEPVKCEVRYYIGWEKSATVTCVAPVERCYTAAADGAVTERPPSKPVMRQIKAAHYVLTTGVNSKLLHYSPYVEYTGNEAAEGHRVYFSGVMVVAKGDACGAKAP